MSAQVEATPADVLKAAIEELFVRGNYTASHYHRYADHDYDAPREEPEAWAVHCAIGGVEHAIWRLTGTNVAPERGLDAHAGKWGDLEDRHTLYAETMRVLNKAAAALAVERQVERVDDVEDLTFLDDEKGETLVRPAFERALAEVVR